MRDAREPSARRRLADRQSKLTNEAMDFRVGFVKHKHDDDADDKQQHHHNDADPGQRASVDQRRRLAEARQTQLLREHIQTYIHTHMRAQTCTLFRPAQTKAKAPNKRLRHEQRRQRCAEAKQKKRQRETKRTGAVAAVSTRQEPDRNEKSSAAWFTSDNQTTTTTNETRRATDERHALTTNQRTASAGCRLPDSRR